MADERADSRERFRRGVNTAVPVGSRARQADDGGVGHERAHTPSAPAPSAPARTMRTSLGEVLRQERHRQQRTLDDVAGDAAVSVPYLSEVERGRKDVSSDLLAAIAGALHLELPEVLERTADRMRIVGRAPARQRHGGTASVRLLAAA